MSSQRVMWLPESLVGDGQTGQTGAVIIHNVVRSVGWTHDLQEKPERGREIRARFSESGVVVSVSF